MKAQESITVERRERLIEQVATVSIEGAVRSLGSGQHRIDLSLLTQPQRTTSDSPARDPERTPTRRFRSISEALVARDGSALVIGTAGSGKTMMALDLVSAALQDARNDLRSPIPILLDLVEWREDRGIEKWILDGLREHYRVPIRIGADMLAHNELLIVADSLDAVPAPARRACATQIGLLRRQRPAIPMVILSRTDAAQDLRDLLPDLLVVVSSLTREQIQAYAQNVGWPSVVVDELMTSASEMDITPQLLRLLTIDEAADRMDEEAALERPSMSDFSARALQRWFHISDDHAACRGLARLFASELRNRRWWTISIGRLASAPPQEFRVPQRLLVVGATMLIGLAVGVAIASVASLVDGVVPTPYGTVAQTTLLLGILVALADAVTTDGHLLDPEGSRSSGPMRRNQSREWLRWGARGASILVLCIAPVGLWFRVGHLTTICLTGVAAGLLIGVLSDRIPWRDAIRWSWRSFFHKLFVRLTVAATAGAATMTSIGVRKGLFVALGLGLGLGLTGALIAGPKRRIEPVVQRRLDITRWVARVVRGTGVVVLIGLGAGTLALAIAASGPAAVEPVGLLIVGVAGATCAALAASLLAFALYGGVEWVQRRSLQWLLRGAGVLSGPLSRRLATLSDGTLLRRAGNGVVFVHRPMIDVLADGLDDQLLRLSLSPSSGYQQIP